MAKTKGRATITRPAMDLEGRENQMIALAVDLAEKQLREGTASSQVITHYLKLGSTKDKLEKEHLKKQNDLLTAKIESLQSSKDIKEMYEEAIASLQEYKGEK